MTRRPPPAGAPVSCTAITIRTERPGDAGAIGDLTTRAFATAPHASGTEAAIVAALRASSRMALSLVAEADGQIVGHVAFSPARIGAASGWLALGPVSVTPQRQRQGIGSALITEGLKRLRSAGGQGVVLLGDPRYYGRLGFAADPGLNCPGTPAEFLLRMVWRGTAPSGRVWFDPAFDAS